MPGRGLDLHIKATGDWSVKLRDLAQKSAIELASDPSGDAARIVKCVRPPSNAPRSTSQIVQGPYGGLTYRDPARFEACMLVAGGSGLTFALAVLEDLIGSALRGGRRRRTRTRIIALVWTVRDADMVRTFAGQLQALLDLARGLVFFSIRIHITGPPTAYDPDKLRQQVPAANLFAGRPELTPLVNGIVSALIGPPDVWRNTPCRGGLHVLACGPSEVIVGVRRAVGGIARARAVQAGGIVVHSESFS